jgi:dihydroorotate dehydrogenase
MIELSKMVKLSNVVISTAMGFGNGIPYFRWTSSDYRSLLSTVKDTNTTIITKSFTPQSKWNIPKVKYLLYHSMFNKYGLKNPGTVKVSRILKEQRRKGFRIIPSIVGKTEFEWFDCIDYLEPDIVELNLSCPNMWYRFSSKSDLIRVIKQKYPDVLLVGKVGVFDDLDMLKKWVDAGLSALHGVNSVSVGVYYDNLKVRSAVLESRRHGAAALPENARKYKNGAFSGRMIYPLAYDFNLEMRKKFPDIPIIMGGGVTEYEDINRYFEIGANSVSICTLAVTSSLEVSSMLKYYNNPDWHWEWGKYADTV